MTEKRFHPFAVLHLLRKTILLYLIPLVQVLFARNWAALWAALVQDLVQRRKGRRRLRYGCGKEACYRTVGVTVWLSKAIWRRETPLTR